ncbi:hypothetical protein BDZ94DRAFT_1162799 [Collybia nuda]|uniref:Uncharacterized protein n=1 Tax=Collybia nuda TaxID=64659 RepID=A0A9P5Y8A5_9AGAR|nr:hypothetical protein BDZ94DRAFT_1162799 [Collybia nuda]
MQFSIALLIPIFALATGASAAECYSQGGSHRCVDPTSLGSYREDYCNNNWQGNGGSKDYNAENGFTARFQRVGAFASQQQCWDSTEDIISQCLGHRDGGTWAGSMMTMNINFCA